MSGVRVGNGDHSHGEDVGGDGEARAQAQALKPKPWEMAVHSLRKDVLAQERVWGGYGG